MNIIYTHMCTHPIHLPPSPHTHIPYLTECLPYVCAQQMCLGSRLRVGSAKFAISINEQTHTHAHTGSRDPKHTHTHTHTHCHTGTQVD